MTLVSEIREQKYRRVHGVTQQNADAAYHEGLRDAYEHAAQMVEQYTPQYPEDENRPMSQIIADFESGSKLLSRPDVARLIHNARVLANIVQEKQRLLDEAHLEQAGMAGQAYLLAAKRDHLEAELAKALERQRELESQLKAEQAAGMRVIKRLHGAMGYYEGSTIDAAVARLEISP